MTEYKRIFLDTAPITYYLEKNAQFCKNVVDFLSQNSDAKFFTSSLTVMEYLVIPYRNNAEDLIDNFYKFLKDFDIEVMNVDSEIGDKAARIRASYSTFKGIDSIQIAVAADMRCDLFLTNDKQLRQYSELRVLTIDELQ